MLELKHLTIGYRADQPLIRNVNLTFEMGKIYALVGRNGTGKSCLLRSMLGILPPLNGFIEINGKSLQTLSIRDRARLIGMISTRRETIGNLRIDEVIQLGRFPYWDPWQKPRLDDKVYAAIDAVKLEVPLDKSIEEVSDGEFQKIMIAKVLAQDAQIILMDEPGAFLDVIAKKDLFALLQNLSRKDGKLIISSSHDLAQVQERTDQSLLLRKDASWEVIPSKDLLIEQL